MPGRDEEARLSDEARFELAMAAAQRERSNRPRALLILAGAALVLAAGVAATGLAARASAADAYRREERSARQVESLLAEYRALQQRMERLGESRREYPRLISHLGDLALQAGMAKAPTPPNERPVNTPAPIRMIDYYYPNVRDPSLEALLEWLRLAQEEIPGLELHDLNSLAPQSNGDWTMSVTFRRWYREG